MTAQIFELGYGDRPAIDPTEVFPVGQLNFQILELENANLVAGEEEEALGRRDLLRNAENLAQGMADF